MVPYRRTTKVARFAIAAALVALVLGIAANIGTAVQAYRNCQAVELVKARVHDVLKESLDNLEKGRLDDEYQRVYGTRWVEAKEEAITNANRQLHRFDPDQCHFIFH